MRKTNSWQETAVICLITAKLRGLPHFVSLKKSQCHDAHAFGIEIKRRKEREPGGSAPPPPLFPRENLGITSADVISRRFTGGCQAPSLVETPPPTLFVTPPVKQVTICHRTLAPSFGDTKDGSSAFSHENPPTRERYEIANPC